ncbi:26S proteasome non-ATPase regulatory subunit 9, partial [Colletotrichum chlorophyti]
MNNIHAPTVPSGPTTSATTNGHHGRLTFAELNRKKEDIEAELKTLGSVLDSVLRTTRARVIHLRNDYNDLMATIEKHIHEHFASLQDGDDLEVPPAGRNSGILSDHSTTQSLEQPFAKVNSVVPGSPADSAGLKAQDEIRNFGY